MNSYGSEFQKFNKQWAYESYIQQTFMPSNPRLHRASGRELTELVYNIVPYNNVLPTSKFKFICNTFTPQIKISHVPLVYFLPRVHLKVDQRVQKNNFPGVHLDESIPRKLFL